MSRLTKILEEGRALVVHDYEYANPASVQEFVVDVKKTKTREDGYLYVLNVGKGPYAIDLCWPVSIKEKLLEILIQRQKLKIAFDNSMSLVYQLVNEVGR